VQGDLHDIGQNLVGMMPACAGYQVIDPGTIVPPARLAVAVRKHRPTLLGLPALLTATAGDMRYVTGAVLAFDGGWTAHADFIGIPPGETGVRRALALALVRHGARGSPLPAAMARETNREARV